VSRNRRTDEPGNGETDEVGERVAGLLVTGCWLLVYWLLVAGCWLYDRGRGTDDRGDLISTRL